MNEAERLAYEQPNADHHIDFAPFIGQIVTLSYHSDRAPGNCRLAAGTLVKVNEHGDPHISAAHGGIIVPAAKVFHISLRDSHLPQFT